MNWDATSETAELLAAIGVIMSLIYLAHQIQQNATAKIRSNEWEVTK